MNVTEAKGLSHLDDSVASNTGRTWEDPLASGYCTVLPGCNNL